MVSTRCCSTSCHTSSATLPMSSIKWVSTVRMSIVSGVGIVARYNSLFSTRGSCLQPRTFTWLWSAVISVPLVVYGSEAIGGYINAGVSFFRTSTRLPKHAKDNIFREYWWTLV